MIAGSRSHAEPNRAHGSLRMVAALALLATWGCGDGGTGPGEPVVGTLQAVSGDAQSGVAGETLPDSLLVRVMDGSGTTLPGVTVAWAIQRGGGSVRANTTTSASGLTGVRWTLGTVAGSASLQATAGDHSVTFNATIRPGAVTIVNLSPATFTLDPGNQQQLALQASDAFGNQVTGATVSWESSEPLIATVDNSGIVRGVGGGTASIHATVQGKVASVTVTVTGPAAPVPTITSITPSPLTPGVTATIIGTNFPTNAGEVTVSVNGVNAAVTPVSATELHFTTPSADLLGCLPLAPVDVVVAIGSSHPTRSQPLRTATPRSFGVGDVAYGTGLAPLGCTELAAGSGQYLIAVYNVGPAFFGSGQPLVNPGPGILVRTAVGTTAGNVAPHAVRAAVVPPTASALPSPPALERIRRHLLAHEQVMEANDQLLPRITLRRRSGFAAQASLTSATAEVGDSLWIRFPDVSKSSSATCSQYDSVHARVARVGTRGIVLEDLAAPLAGQIDSLYERLADNFDQVQYPLLRDNFGDPLILDSQLNNDGHIFMLFTRKVNNLMDGSILGYVWSGDFDDGTLCHQSNHAEIFYGIVPTIVSGGTLADWNIPDWYDYLRSTVVHEVKHLASFAARAHNNDLRFSADSMWLEEATAMAAEELWARTVFGYQQDDNVGFNQSILCELNLSGCTAMPVVMLNHFGFLYDYYDGMDGLSFLGRISTDDATFYGSAWAFLRWVTDQSGMAESQFLTGLTQAATAGMTSIQNLTGGTYEELFREFILASLLDDRPGFSSTNPRLTQPSWDTRDVFDGMSHLFVNGDPPFYPFPLAFPLVPAVLAPPGVSVSQVRPGGAATFELDVPATSAQAFDVRAVSGGALPANLRVVMVRVQ